MKAGLKVLFRSTVILAIAMSAGISCQDDAGNDSQHVSGKWVSIEKLKTHYAVTIDYRTGATRYQAGQEYGKLVRQIMPDFESTVDSCLQEFDEIGKMEAAMHEQDSSYIQEENNYSSMITNIHEIKNQIPVEYRDEIEGFASAMSGSTSDICGDGKLSNNEIYILSTLPDLVRAIQCNGIGVFGSLSSTGHTMVSRALDFYSGTKAQFSRTQAVIVIKNNESSICFVGFLGNLGATTVFNEDGVYAAVLDSPIKISNSFNGKYSYVMDLRYAVEILQGNNNLETIADYMTHHDYVFNHNILLADKDDCQVLENNLVNNRTLRTSTSELNDGITWNFAKAICVVNSFVLKGNTDNHTRINNNNEKNTRRWSSFSRLLARAAEDNSVTPEELRSIVSYHGDPANPETYSDIFSHLYRGVEYESASPYLKYNGFVYHTFFIPETLELKVYFRPASGPLNDPVYESINVSFD